MPKVPIDYSKTVLYKLVHFDDLNDENIYVGYCTNITQRRHCHKKACCNPDDKSYNHYKYQFIRENGGWDQWEMILIEKYPCDDVDQAIARERYWKRELNATLNTNEPGRTQKEWREDNKEKIAEYKKEYRKNNKEEIAEKQKQWHNDNREKILQQKKEYYENNKEKKLKGNKQWRENNKEKYAKQRKENYENNKDIINEKAKEKITCDCGSIIRKSDIARHRNSNKHQEWVKK